MTTDPHLWPSAAFDPSGRIAALEAALARETTARAEAEADVARLTRDLCSIAMHSHDGRAGLPLLWRAVFGAGMPWGVAQ